MTLNLVFQQSPQGSPPTRNSIDPFFEAYVSLVQRFTGQDKHHQQDANCDHLMHQKPQGVLVSIYKAALRCMPERILVASRPLRGARGAWAANEVASASLRGRPLKVSTDFIHSDHQWTVAVSGKRRQPRGTWLGTELSLPMHNQNCYL